MLFKAVEPHPLDVGGRLLAAGEAADLDPADPTVAAHADCGHLAPVQPVPAAGRPKRTTTTEET